MKLFLTILSLVVLCGCSQAEPGSQSPITNAVVNPRDFILMSVTAVSNANRFQKPPDGWRVVCDGGGHYAPQAGGRGAVDNITYYGTNTVIRATEFEAVVACWRIKEIWNTPMPDHPTNQWHDCESDSLKNHTDAPTNFANSVTWATNSLGLRWSTNDASHWAVPFFGSRNSTNWLYWIEDKRCHFTVGIYDVTKHVGRIEGNMMTNWAGTNLAIEVNHQPCVTGSNGQWTIRFEP